MAMPVRCGVDRYTGRPISGWPHVVQSIDKIFTTTFGTRPMRRWFGSLIPVMLGENISQRVMLLFGNAIQASLEFEPGFKLTLIDNQSDANELRAGRLRLVLNGQYRPRAHLGDFTVEGSRQLLVGATEQRLTVEAL